VTPKTPEDPQAAELRWREETYAGDVPQLTLRAVLTGALLGAFLALSNLYVGLKAGWALGVAITACLLSAVSWRAIHRVGWTKSPLSILEQNCMQSTASAAGYSTGAVMVSAIPAYLMVTGVRIQPGWLMLWTFFLATLGVCLTIPLKRALIHHQELPFPSGIAAAETLRGLHRTGEEAGRQARALFSAMGVGALVQWCLSTTARWWPLPLIPDPIPLPGRLAGRPLGDYTVGIDGSTVFVAAGAILGLPVTTWMLVGSTLAYLVLAPWMAGQGWIGGVGYRDVLLSFGLWGGASLMVSASLVDLLARRDLLRRALGDWGGLRSGPRSGDPLADVEPPRTWFLGGVAVCTLGILVVGAYAFAMPWWIGLGCVAASLIAVLVTCRATGETDIAPVGDLGKLTQLGAGMAAPGSLTTNLMAASVTATASAAASDLMVNHKCGTLLGANARRQFLAQLCGVVIGTLVVVPAFALLVPTPDRLGTQTFPAPAAQAWRFMAELMAGGVDALEPAARIALAMGTGLGVVLALLRRRWDGWWMPHPMGVGMGMVLFHSNSLSFFLGALLGWLVRRRSPRAGELVVPVSSGLIAGESLMGILLAILVTVGVFAAG